VPYFVNHHTPTAMPESYAEIEDRIEQAYEKLYQCSNPNISAVAREFQVPRARLKARWNGRQSKQQRPAVNRRLTDAQELVICLYFDRLHSIGTSARYSVLIDCANFITLVVYKELVNTQVRISRYNIFCNFSCLLRQALLSLTSLLVSLKNLFHRTISLLSTASCI